ncbi:hypothetical protein U1Q18_042726 [Sarracenia purpurea var. burkii]
MGNPKVESDEPLTPVGRTFLQPEMYQVINCIMGLKSAIDADSIRSEISNSAMLKHPRFSSLMVKDRHGREHWRKTEVDVNRHVIVIDEPVGDVAGAATDDDDEEAVNDYVADLTVSSPLSTDKPLWEIHLLKAHKCIVFRIHHALGDGISLMSMLLQSCRRADDPDQRPSIASVGTSSSSSDRRGGRKKFGRVLKAAWFTVVFVVEFVLRTLWVRDQRTAVSGGPGVELWPRKLATAKFRLDDLKAVKRAVVNAVSVVILFYFCSVPNQITVRFHFFSLKLFRL